jgi:hypothetical protein
MIDDNSSNNSNTIDETLERRIAIATEGVRTKFIESTLRDRKRLCRKCTDSIRVYDINEEGDKS